MILQFSHYLAEELRRKGHPNVEIRATVRSSLNDRPRELLVDPDINLAAEPRNLRRARWILPLDDSGSAERGSR